MILHNQIDIVNLLTKLQKRGFTHSFELRHNMLYCAENDRLFSQEELQIVEYHRLYSKSDGKDRIIFAIETLSELKGILNVQLIGSAGFELLTFMDKVKVQPRKD